eukprot:1078642-Rhodomonas_salina.1
MEGSGGGRALFTPKNVDIPFPKMKEKNVHVVYPATRTRAVTNTFDWKSLLVAGPGAPALRCCCCGAVRLCNPTSHFQR